MSGYISRRVKVQGCSTTLVEAPSVCLGMRLGSFGYALTHLYIDGSLLLTNGQCFGSMQTREKAGRRLIIIAIKRKRTLSAGHDDSANMSKHPVLIAYGCYG
jgi:hypothetical protein